MRCCISYLAILSLLFASCGAAPERQGSRWVVAPEAYEANLDQIRELETMRRDAGASAVFASFSSRYSSKELEQDYRFSAQLAGMPKGSKEWNPSTRFVRDFPQGTPVLEVIRSLQADLCKEFYYRPSHAEFMSSGGDPRWMSCMAFGDSLAVGEFTFVPIDQEQEGRIVVIRIISSQSEAPSFASMVAD